MDPLNQYSDVEDEMEVHLEEESAVEQTVSGLLVTETNRILKSP